MDFLICDKNRMELGNLSDQMSVDFDIGDTNDVQVKCQRGDIENGMYIVCPGTEFGAVLEEMEESTDSRDVTWYGDSFRKFLEQTIIEPPSGQDYRTVSGDAHDIMRGLIGDELFTVPTEPSGITISGYQFTRYTDALSGFTAMLEEKGARINIEIVQGDSNEPFSVSLTAVQKRNMAAEIEYSQDSAITVTMTDCRRGITHLICLGQGELRERTVVHLYLQYDGSVSEKQYYTGFYDRQAVYDYSSAESREELVRYGTERLLELAPSEKVEMSVNDDVDLQIGDTIAARNYDTGLFIEKPVVGKIATVENGVSKIEYKMEGE